MKKVSLFTLALFTGLAMFAQQTPQLTTPMSVTTRFGIKGGVNLNNLSPNSESASMGAPGTSVRTAYNGGVFANIPISDVIRFQPEVMFSSQGSKMTSSVSTPTGATYSSYNTELNYINVPLVFQAQTRSGLYIETGPQVGYLLGAKNKDNNGSGHQNIKGYLDKFDFTWTGGIGYISRVGLGIDARYNWGITNIIDSKNSMSSTAFNYNGKLRNRDIQIGLFYQFGAGK